MAETRIAKGPVDFSIANTQRMLRPVKSFAQSITGNGTVPQDAPSCPKCLDEGGKLTAPRPSKTL
jgi:hypothetical protein